MDPHQLDQILRQLSVLQAHQDTLNTKLLAALEQLTLIASQLAVLVDTHLRPQGD